MQETQKAYWAGMLDGEGSIIISKAGNKNPKWHPSHFLRVMIGQSNKEFVTLAQKEFECGSITERIMKERVINGVTTTKRSVIWYWHTTTNNAEKVLKLLLPHLKLKKKQAEIALEFQQYKRKTTPRGRVENGKYASLTDEAFKTREAFKQQISALNNNSSTYDEA